MSEVAPSDGVAHKTPARIGLLGLGVTETSSDDQRPLQTVMPKHRAWLRYLKFALFGVVPIGVAYAAHVASQPEGLDVPESSASGARMMGSASTLPAASVLPRRVFDSGAFGHSGAVRVRIVLPGESVALPMRLVGPTDGLTARWLGFSAQQHDDARVPWPSDAVLTAPAIAGGYWLVLERAGVADTVADFAMLVERPMPNTRATGINGYHLGRWPKASGAIIPRGFVEVTERIADFPLSPHLRMSDFVVHDAQDGYPKYLHVREPLLDKLELIISEVARMRGGNVSALTLHVASGFRSPAYNGSLSTSAQDSRHMYGDAADIAIDANGDGRLTEIDARLVAAAAEVVEQKYPDLIGGIGLYINADGAGWPYVHIDTRGVRARWRGGPKRDVVVDSFPTAGVVDVVPFVSGMDLSSPTADTSPAARRPAAFPPQPATPPAATPPRATPPAGTPPAGTPPAAASPAASSPAATSPAGTSPAGAPPVMAPPATRPSIRPVSNTMSNRVSTTRSNTVSTTVSNTVSTTRSNTVSNTVSTTRSNLRSNVPVGPEWTPAPAAGVKPAPRPSRPAERKVRASASTRGADAPRGPAATVSDDPFASASRRFRAARP